MRSSPRRSTSWAALRLCRCRWCATAPTGQLPCKQTWNWKSGSCSSTGTRVAEAGTLGLPEVAEALRPLLGQTQDHVIELRDALGK
jgi:hypothetical protein